MASCLKENKNHNYETVNFRYHVPRSWLKPRGNLLVVFEEWGGDPAGISLARRSTTRVCADIVEGQPSIKSWHMPTSVKSNSLQLKAHLWCPAGLKISDIQFASYELPQGTCRKYHEGSCHAHKSSDAFERYCQFLFALQVSRLHLDYGLEVFLQTDSYYFLTVIQTSVF